MFPSNIEQLPDNIILEILSYLSVKDLCISGQVSRRWRRIARDNSLWRHVDLLPYRLVPQRIWKVIRTHLSECLLTLKIKGFVDTGLPNQKKHSLTNAMLQDIKERCPNIKELYLHGCNTEILDATLLPMSITSLTIASSSWKPRWLKQALFSNLIYLSLKDSVRVDNFDVEDIIKFTDIKKLILRKCYRISDPGFQKIATSFTNLEELDLSCTECSDLALHHFSRHLVNLHTLVLTNCKNITDSGLFTLVTGLKKLENLDVTNSKKITNEGIMKCKGNNKSLKEIISHFNDRDIG